MKKTDDIRKILAELLGTQRLAVLSTHREGEPYASLVAFVATEDLGEILFVTPRTTRKYANLKVEPRASLLVDNRSNRESDFHLAVAVTATGLVWEAGDEDREACLSLYLARHPHLVDFAKSPSCALMVLKVSRYNVVRHFQSVTELRVAP